jgi:hypothetical protein
MTVERYKYWRPGKPFPLLMIEGTSWMCSWVGESKRYAVQFTTHPRIRNVDPCKLVTRYYEVAEDETQLPEGPHWYFVWAFPIKDTSKGPKDPGYEVDVEATERYMGTWNQDDFPDWP